MISSSRAQVGVLSLVWLVGAWLIFVLPWHMPAQSRLVSDSYILGFSNKTALLGLGVTLVALFFLFNGFQRSGENVFNGRVDRLLRPSRVTRPEYLFLLLFTAFHWAFITCWFRAIPLNNFGEMGYTVSRTELILLGNVPYQNFEWNYGPFFLYLPALFVKLSNYRLSADWGYFWSLLLCTALSFCGVYYVLAQFRLRPWQRVLIFLLLCSILNISLGVNTTLTRFILPFAALFFLYNESLKRGTKGRGGAILLLEMVGSVLLCFFVSPETGVVFSAGLIFFSAVQVKRGLIWYLSGVCIAIGLGFATVMGLSSSYLRSMATFGGGACNYPVVPSAPILLFLTTICILFPQMASYAWKANRKSAPMAAGLAIMAVCFSAAALGRCDVGHVFYNSVGLFIFALAFWLRYPPRFQLYVPAFALFFTFGYQFIYALGYTAVISDAMELRAQGVPKVDRHFFEAAAPTTDLALLELGAQLRPFKQVGMPLGASEEIEILLKRNGLYVCEFFPLPSLELRTPLQLERKVEDMQKMPYVIIDKADLYPSAYNAADYARQQERLLSQVQLYLLEYKIKHPPFFPKVEIARYIRSHFTPVMEYKSYIVMKNNGAKL